MISCERRFLFSNWKWRNRPHIVTEIMRNHLVIWWINQIKRYWAYQYPARQSGTRIYFKIFNGIDCISIEIIINNTHQNPSFQSWQLSISRVWLCGCEYRGTLTSVLPCKCWISSHGFLLASNSRGKDVHNVSSTRTRTRAHTHTRTHTYICHKYEADRYSCGCCQEEKNAPGSKISLVLSVTKEEYSLFSYQMLLRLPFQSLYHPPETDQLFMLHGIRLSSLSWS